MKHTIKIIIEDTVPVGEMRQNRVEIHNDLNRVENMTVEYVKVWTQGEMAKKVGSLVTGVINGSDV